MLDNLMHSINYSEEDRYSRWAEHRNHISSLINGALTPASGPKTARELIVCGAGRCDDLDFAFLEERFAGIVLADIDDNTLNNVVAGLPRDLQAEITVVSFDFSGLDKVEYYRNLEQPAREGNLKKIIRLIRNTALQVTAPGFPDDKKFDFVLSTPVYSQLCYVPSLLILAPHVANFTRKEIEKIKQELVYLTHIVIANYNQMLADLCRETGKIAAISDILDLSALPQPIKANMDRDKLHASLCQLLSSGYGVVGGYYGVENLKTLLKEETAATEEWIWDFSGERKFYTCGICGERKECQL